MNKYRGAWIRRSFNVSVPLLLALVSGRGAQAQPSFNPIKQGARDLGGGVTDLAGDAWDVLVSPTELDRRSGLALGGVVTGGLILFALDERLQREVAGVHAGAFQDLGEWLEPVGLQGKTNKVFVAGIVAGYLTGQDWLKQPAKEVLFSQWIAGLIRQGVGEAVGRRRPNEGAGPYAFDPGGGTSFPSGHSSSIVVVASVLAHHIDRWPVTALLYAGAGSVLFQRLESESHWASDVWIGAALGAAVSRIVMRSEANRRLQIQPRVSPSGSGYGLGVSIMF